MPTPLNIGTRDIPLKLAQSVTARVNMAWESGEILAKVSSTTRDLLTFWFCSPHTEVRHANFHPGQQQAILNTVYLHEVLGIQSVKDIYEKIHFELLAELDAVELTKEKYDIPKYAIKMATGTGKTWVMHALLLWQYLNAKDEETQSGKFSKNFLLVAPGLIVYERLLDAYLGKENEQGGRDFESSDLYKFRDLFIPPSYRDSIFGFIQNAVAKKEEIGSKVTGEGLIAIANWHLFVGKEEGDDMETASPLDDPSGVVRDIFPIRPGTAGGNDLNALDSAYQRGKELEFLASLPDLVCINDEAHHIHENKTYGEVNEVEWQKSLNRIAKTKAKRFMQVDFSATPYDVTGSGQKRVKHYFPHTVIDFNLKTAIHGGFVKLIAIDRRKELTDVPLEFRTIRENGKVVGLSEGQKFMLRIGLSKLRILEKYFVEFTADKSGVSDKHPKMLVMCEDTTVSPFVIDFLHEEGLGDEDLMRIDSNRKGEVPEKEWKEIKQRLFNVDKHATPKVIVSVLMLREGFDVNNICVIVPLRSSEAPILLEQTIGRGLRLMWREPIFAEMKEENRQRLLVEKREPVNYLDLLTIVEHPAFLQFYEDLDKEMIPGLGTDPEGKGGVLGDILTVGLKSGYERYDMYWPIILREAEEELKLAALDVSRLEPFTAYPLENLKRFFSDGEKIVSMEVTVKTSFGEYVVDANLFHAESYNEYLQKILRVVTTRLAKIGRKVKELPVMQVNQVALVEAIDSYIRTRLFDVPFDPFEGNNWKVLLLKSGIVTQHIVKEIGKIVFAMQQGTESTEAEVVKKYFSEVAELRMRENYSLPIAKAIFDRLPFPSNRGGFEREFLEYTDRDSRVESLMKVNEYYHDFARVAYLRSDGLLSFYTPDFVVKTGEKIYIVETKADRDLNDANVRQKQVSVVDWVARVNSLSPENRMEREWEYVLLGENHFKSLKDNGASIDEMLGLAKVSEAAAKGRLFE